MNTKQTSQPTQACRMVYSEALQLSIAVWGRRTTVDCIELSSQVFNIEKYRRVS